MSSPLFVLDPSNDYPALLLKNLSQWTRFDLEFPLNFRSLIAEQKELIFEFYVEDSESNQIKKEDQRITLANVGALVFPSYLALTIFPSPCPELEFLPVQVNGEDWRLLNCLKTTKGYDAEASQFLRGEGDKIFWVQHLVVTDPSIEECELFTLEDSNRALIFCLPSFKERIEKLGLKGLSFREIGVYEPQPM